MSKICEISGTKVSFGHKMKHRKGSSGGGGHWKFRSQKVNRTWEPNLRKIKVTKDGKTTTITVAMKTYKALRNYGSLDGYQLVKAKINV